jgi:hypothetical protein
MGANPAANAGEVPGCTPTRKQQVIGVYYGVVDATDAAAVRDPANGRTAPLIDSRYFVMVVPLGRLRYGTCTSCENLRAISPSGKIPGTTDRSGTQPLTTENRSAEETVADPIRTGAA